MNNFIHILLCFGQDVMLLGDFNADCGYLPKKYRKNVRLITDNKLYWLIPDKTDTTVRESTSCAYDRWGHSSTCIASCLDTTPVWTNSDHNMSKMWIHHTREYFMARLVLSPVWPIFSNISMNTQPRRFDTLDKWQNAWSVCVSFKVYWHFKGTQRPVQTCLSL